MRQYRVIHAPNINKLEFRVNEVFRLDPDLNWRLVGAAVPVDWEPEYKYCELFMQTMVLDEPPPSTHQA